MDRNGVRSDGPDGERSGCGFSGDFLVLSGLRTLSDIQMFCEILNKINKLNRRSEVCTSV